MSAVCEIASPDDARDTRQPNGLVASHARSDDGTCIYFERVAATPDSAGPRERKRAGKSPVLLVMGLGANGRLWGPIVRRLVASGYEVITFDNRGCGRSSTPWRPWTTRTMAADAVAVLDELDVDRAHVVGASLGGMIAQELALEFPDRVSTLVLGCTTGGLPRLDLVPRGGFVRILGAALRSTSPLSDRRQRVSDFLHIATSEDFAARCRPGSEPWEAVAAMLEDPTTPRGFGQQLLACARHASWSRLGRLSMPVQVHHGSADRVMPFPAGRELARRIPGARFEIHEGAGHALGLERPDEIFDRAMTFIAQAAGIP